ncbi:Retrovirus-related Pol polyprotein from transposon TNT 1-94 [Araneus ventricosus]|uniref:Retrovirus-related Pol polyprotein from transposon TNT 1-94 n=1 Tax=Araneus ventricosus TaxID=182803 RepID=A0A4Y2NTK3_ARAVE|nr:Retrovirus-related Pol polyprotein from transposon TNT 1-94 [Araneus ventricosus]
MRKKSEVVNCLKTFIIDSEAAGHQIKELLIDGGTEFSNSEVKVLLASKGIINRISMPYTPEQNGAAERENRTLVKCARSLIHTIELQIKLWAEAINTSVHVLNRTAKTSVPGKSPYEVWFNKEKPCIDHLCIFGTECCTLIPKQQRRKWDPKKDESSDSTVQKENSGECVNTVNSVSSVNSGLSLSRARREIKRPLHLRDYILMAEFSNPDLYASAMASNDADRWKQTTDEYMNSLKGNEIRDLVELPQVRSSLASERLVSTLNDVVSNERCRLTDQHNDERVFRSRLDDKYWPVN